MRKSHSFFEVMPPALELAHAFLDYIGEWPQRGEVERIEGVAICVGEHLADRGFPGAWAALDAREFFDQVAFLCDHDRVVYAMTMIGMVHWMWKVGLLAQEDAQRITRDIEAHAPANRDLGEVCEAAYATWRLRAS